MSLHLPLQLLQRGRTTLWNASGAGFMTLFGYRIA